MRHSKQRHAVRYRKYRHSMAAVLCCALALAPLSESSLVAAFPIEISYGGRIVDSTGKPELGPIDLLVTFLRLATGDDTALAVSVPTFSSTVLVDGIFQLKITLSDTDLNTLLGGSESPYVQVTDLTHGKAYPRQRFTAIPYALRVPVDETTVTYDANGRLKAVRDTSGTIGADSGNATVLLRAAPGTASGTKYTLPAAPNPGAFLQTDANGNLTWTTPAGAGDMARATYDTNTDGVVDTAATVSAVLADNKLSNNVTKLGQTIGTAEIEDGAITAAKLSLSAGSVALNGGSSLTLATATANHANHQWTSQTSGENEVVVTNGTQVTITKKAAGASFSSWVYWPESVGRNFDLAFRLSGLTPLTAERNIAIAIASDGTNNETVFDRLLIRIAPANSAALLCLRLMPRAI